MNGNYSTSPEEESATGRPVRDPLTGHLLSPRSATTDRQARTPASRGSQDKAAPALKHERQRCSLISLPLRMSGERLTAAVLARARARLAVTTRARVVSRIAGARYETGTSPAPRPSSAVTPRSTQPLRLQVLCAYRAHARPPQPAPANADKEEVPGSSPGSPTSPRRGRARVPSTTVLVHGCHTSR